MNLYEIIFLTLIFSSVLCLAFAIFGFLADLILGWKPFAQWLEHGDEW